jgi:hypothetical protein
VETTRFLFNAKRMTLTYGELPPYEVFEQAWEGDLGPDRRFEVRNCKRFGNESFDCKEMWAELNQCVREWENDGPDEAGDWASCVLETLGFEWV